MCWFLNQSYVYTVCQMGVLFSFSMSGEQNAYLWRQLIVVYIPYSVLLLYGLGEQLSQCDFHSAQPSLHRARKADPTFQITSNISVVKTFVTRTVSCKNIFYSEIVSGVCRELIHFYSWLLSLLIFSLQLLTKHNFRNSFHTQPII